ncbi:hypothetical protein BDP27DRAFT_1339796 [Rhodocollybia butyracea]|uniref:Uncharacterized protein n=1 Tax=Rhodocollybia butyracea TaxID=206335 RepID=A0A9P5PBA4_9AGAR|nr:hypothetical protein BDP27DRAFT_1339796 [Rhodocollybia butyracea]
MYAFKLFTAVAFATIFGVLVSAEVYHCDGPDETCPPGYRCCGPISVEYGGTCFLGTKGICPL